jgi:tRNA(fMet)-specific endonuclease VapC
MSDGPNEGSVALDTSVAIELLQRPDQSSEIGDWILPVQVAGELRFGALNSARVSTNLAKVDSLLGRCKALDATSATAVAYADLRLALQTKGRLIPENDLWIAAACLEHGLPLATNDHHFDYVDGLNLRSLGPPLTGE